MTPVDNFVLALTQPQLDQYPDSLLSVLASSRWTDTNLIALDMSERTLRTLQIFFDMGSWPNPYLWKNKGMIQIPGVDDNFEVVCDYLGLPTTFSEEDLDVEEEEFEEEIIELSDDEAAFGQSIIDEQNDEYDGYDPFDYDYDPYDYYSDSD